MTAFGKTGAPCTSCGSVLLDLAERCERATAPDAEADYQIHALVMGWRTPDELHCFSWCVGENYQFGHPDDFNRAIYISESDLPNYTASLDAAMTLVPEGLVWSLNTFGNPPKASGYVMNERGEQWRCKDYPATPALALCAAALRARAAQGGDQ